MVDKRRRSQPPRAMELAGLYRSASTDLALADGFHVSQRIVRHLHRLVARSHLAWYPQRLPTWRSLVDLIFVTVPGQLYRDACLRVGMIAFFGVFALCMVLGAWQPGLVADTLGQDMIDQMRDMYADHPSGRSAEDAAAMQGFYINNNVGIALMCFSSGVFLGIGSLIFLSFNGVVLGLIFGAMFTVDAMTRSHFFEFVTAHGPFELTGIALAGAAGLRMGLGLVDSAGHTRLMGLQLAAARAAPIIAVAAALVALAAPIEAWVSPSSLPLNGKRAVAATCAVLLVWYLAVMGARGDRILRQRHQQNAAAEHTALGGRDAA